MQHIRNVEDGSSLPMVLPSRKSITILVVDDEPQVRTTLRRGLEAEGYSVSEAASKAALLDRLEASPPVSLITLDLTLGDEDGLQLAREIRIRRNLPIIMITGRGTPIDRVTGLEHGADDYIVKPFLIREVLMRVQSVLRRYELEGGASDAEAAVGVEDERYACDAGELDVRRRILTGAGGTKVDLTDAEFDILVLFLRNPGRVLSRDDFALMLKGRRWQPTDRTIDGHIARLRKKIEPRIEDPTIIKTVWRVGYVFAGDARRLPPA